MRNPRLRFVNFALIALLLSLAASQVQAQDAKFAGTWQVTMAAGEQGGGGGGHHGGGGGGGAHTLTITQDGDTLKGTMAGGQFNRDFTAKRAS